MQKLKHQHFGHLMQRTNSFKRPFSGKDWRWEEKVTTEDKMVGWHHWLSGLSLSKFWDWWWTGKPGVLQSMGHKEQDMTNWLNWTEPLKWTELNWWNPYQRWYTLNTSLFNAGELSKSLHVALAAIETALSEGLVYVYIIPIFGTIMYEVKEEACHLLSC